MIEAIEARYHAILETCIGPTEAELSEGWHWCSKRGHTLVVPISLGDCDDSCGIVLNNQTLAKIMEDRFRTQRKTPSEPLTILPFYPLKDL